MPRRREVPKREVLPDPKYISQDVAKFVNVVMTRGKKSVAERMVYGAFEQIARRADKDPLEVFSSALSNIRPMVEVKSRRVGGANYQVPVEVRSGAPHCAGDALAARRGAQARREIDGRTASPASCMEAAEGRGGAMKKREEVHRMAEANKAFSHYRF